MAGCFVFVGTEPNVAYLQPENSVVKQTRGGWIDTNDKMETSVEGVFAAGDIRDKYLRQVVTAAGDGAVAAMAAYAYITEQLHLRSVLIDPEEVVALFTSSIDQGQVQLQVAAEKFAKESGKKIAFIDGYRNGKMVEKLGIAKLPTIVEMRKGAMVRSAEPTTIEEIKNFLA